MKDSLLNEYVGLYNDDLYFSRKRNKVNILNFSNVFFFLKRIGIYKLEDSERED